ncbi:MAG: hypothetical protein GF334_07380 [Candidatus Altiarchaeales archaeon]|nr:hypothetical protein [Candidatus Altiarchaeales archaeon]
MTWFSRRKKAPLRQEDPLIDPKQFLIPEVLTSPGLTASQAFDDAPKITKRFRDSLRAYEKELQLMAFSKRKNGRPLFDGLGLYPEIGADLIPCAYTRACGRLVGMGLHESEMLCASALLHALSLDPQKVVGEYVDSGPIKRISDAGKKDQAMSLSREMRQRLSQNKRGIGKEIGTRDWMHWGRYINWKHFTFLPSASSDTIILQDYLGGRKFDYVMLSGTWDYRFQKQEGENQYRKYVEQLDEHFMASDALVFVGAHEKSIEPVLIQRGYKEITPYETPEYPKPPIDTISVTSRYENKDVLGVSIRPGKYNLTFVPGGLFTVYEKQKK